MKCNKISIWISRQLDGELTAAEERRLQEHLSQCAGCRKAYEELRAYRETLSLIENPDTPEKLHDRIMNSLISGQNPVRSNHRTLIHQPWFYPAMAAAALLVLVFLVAPIRYFRPAKVVTEYSFFPGKSGKGPLTAAVQKQGDPDTKVQDILALAKTSDMRILEENRHPVSGKMNSIVLRAKRKQYAAFRRAYMALSPFDSMPEKPVFSLSPAIEVQVYFPGRTFLRGDFNGDGRSDLLCWHTRGKYAGRAYLSVNNENGIFSSPHTLNWPSNPGYLPAGSTFLAADINGDRYDDILLIGTGSHGNKTAWSWLNDRTEGFHEEREIKLDSALNSPLGGYYLAGDVSGDGHPDICLLYREGSLRGSWLIVEGKYGAFNGKSYLANGLFEEPEENEKYTPLLLDFNGDGYAEPMIYWQSGEKIARWMIALNNGDGSFSNAFQVYFGNSPLAFMGHYLPVAGDFTGDGRDDLLVKLGSADDYTEWYLMINQGGEKFSMGHEVRFGNQSDMGAY